MATKKITMQDIAAACGLSRNTVSKVFNDRGSVPEVTRQQVLTMARQMGYRQLTVPENTPAPQGRSIALLTLCMPGRNHYGSNFISSFANRMSRAGYTLNATIWPQTSRKRPSILASGSVFCGKPGKGRGFIIMIRPARRSIK